jgi:hypothetical protein
VNTLGPCQAHVPRIQRVTADSSSCSGLRRDSDMCVLQLFTEPIEPLASESESHVTTDGQPASLSWNKAPIWGLGPDLYCCQTVAGLLMWGALSDERTGLSFTIAAGPRQRSHSRDHILLSRVRDSPNLEGQVPVFIYPRNRVARLYPQTLGNKLRNQHQADRSRGLWVILRP